MKKILLLVAIVMFGMIACTEGNNNEVADEPEEETQQDSVEGAPSNEFRGVVGDGTSMHSLEFIRETGDTLYLAYEDNAVGGVACGDKVDVTIGQVSGEITATSIVNLSSLAHVWKVVKTGRDQHLELDEQGTATSYGMHEDYIKWNVINGKLILDNGEEKFNYDIELLTEDSLIIVYKDRKVTMIKEN